MSLTEEQLMDHIFRLVYLVRNAACYRSLEKYQREFQNYWTLIYNNFFDIAILEWCKIFGTDSEPTHWKKLVDDHDSFRKSLLSRLRLNEDAWVKYREEVKTYRDNLISHHQRNPAVKSYPFLDKALASSYYYYEWLIQKLRDAGNNQYPNDLESYYNRFFDQSQKFSEAAYSATIDFKEQVY